jgi:soluble lytic murein transglycosylase-like protein
VLRPPHMTPAGVAAGICAALVVITASAELTEARGSEVGGGLGSAAADSPIAGQEPAAPEPPESGEAPAIEVTPTPAPSPSPRDPEPAPPVAEDLTPPVAAAPEAPAETPPTRAADAPDPGAARTGDAAAGLERSPDVAPRREAAPERARTDRARTRPNTEVRADGLRRSGPDARERLERERRRNPGGGAPAGGAPAGGAPPASSGRGPASPTGIAPAQSLSRYVAAEAIAIPDAAIDGFGVPPFLLPIYQAAGLRYGVPWEILAAINEIETAYGRNLAVSSAGALGWMQFMPSTWEAYGVDADDDGRRDPFDPVDAIFAAARYLQAAGAGTDLPKAIYAYNPADWYVKSVLARARLIAQLPSDLVDSLTGLAGGRFPVRAESTYAVDRRGRERAPSAGAQRRGIAIFSRSGAPVIAVNDGRVVRVGHSARLGRFVTLRDVHGNTYTYARLGRIGGARRAGKRLRQGDRLEAGATLGRLARGTRPHLRFRIRPAGHDAPRIDPKPILDGWTALGSGSLSGRGARPPRTSGIGPMGAGALARRVLADPRIEIYGCGRDDIRAGRIDRRVLATLELLADSGLAPTVSSLRCGHGVYTASGNVSEHTTGSAVDISAINGIPIAWHQGPGSVTEQTIQSLLTLQGTMKPHQIISLMTFAGADNTFAMGDHADHIHVGFRPATGPGAAASPSAAVLEPHQWPRLIARIDEIGRPVISRAAPD